MMKGKERDDLYRPMEKNHVVKILDDKKVRLDRCGGGGGGGGGVGPQWLLAKLECAKLIEI